jgi:transglutaminase-like putative cysteine protease
MLMLNHVVTELDQAGQRGPTGTTTRRVFFRGPLTRVSLVAAAITFSLAGGLFFIIPRVGQAALPLRAQVGRMVTGFSDRVDLGSFGDIENDHTVVMRVYLTDERVDPARLPTLRWRGVAFDHFDGITWSGMSAPRRFLRRGVGGDFGVALPETGAPVLRQEIYLEPIGTDAVFGAARVLRMELRAPSLVMDDMGSLSTSHAPARLHYLVESEVESPDRRARSMMPMSAAERGRYLQLPALSPEVAGLAHEVRAGAPDPQTIAQRISDHLSTNYRYTLALKRQTSRPPLEEFLFVRRSGNCEYFAAAMAVMLRSEGIPSRVVAGFQQGEWNPYGRYFMVRLSDAHSWVEAYIDGRGWVTFDPSPRGETTVETLPGSVSLYFDAARMRWYRYVVNWSLRDQVQIAQAVHRGATDFRLSFSLPRGWWSRSTLLAGAALVVIGLLAWLARHPGPTWRRSGAGGEMPAFYARALRLLARRGLFPGASETARQFASRVRATTPDGAEAFAQLTGHYERARFGSAALTEADRQDVTRALAALRARRT